MFDGNDKPALSENAMHELISKARVDVEAARTSERPAAPAAPVVDVDLGEPTEQEVERRISKLARTIALNNQSGGASIRSIVASHFRESWKHCKKVEIEWVAPARGSGRRP